ncbi:hypothetical protein MMC25_007705 [Agyrium rufum]|nr:hypothetical protein [Agyrium rufum]
MPSTVSPTPSTRETRSLSRSMRSPSHKDIEHILNLPKYPQPTQPSNKPSPNKPRPTKTTQGSPTPEDTDGDELSELCPSDEENGSGGFLDDEDEDDDSDDPIVHASSAVQFGRQTRPTNIDGDRKNAGKNNLKRAYSSDSSDAEEPSHRAKSLKSLAAASLNVAEQSDSDEEEEGDDDEDEDEDEDDYTGIDAFTDADQEESLIEELEEQDIIADEEEAAAAAMDLFSLPSSPFSQDWNGFDLEGGLFLDNVPYFDQQLNRSDPADLAIDIGLFNAAPTQCENASTNPVTPAPRRVHFADDVLDTKSTYISDLEEIESGYPKPPFLDQDDLDPSFRTLMDDENDFEVRTVSDDDAVYGDFQKNAEFEYEKFGLDDSSSDESCGKSGYETDQGETTDEEVLPPITVHRPQAMLRLNSYSFSQRKIAPTPTPTPIRRSSKSARLPGPRLGSFTVNSSKAVAVVDRTGKHMVIFGPTKPVRPRQLRTEYSNSASSSVMTSPKASFTELARAISGGRDDPSEPSSQEMMGPMIGIGANLMIPGLLQDASSSENNVFGGQISGPPEAFYSINNLDDEVLSENDIGDTFDDHEMKLNVDDFIDFGDTSSDEDATVQSLGLPSATVTAPASPTGSTPSQSLSSPTTKVYDLSASALLHHFNRHNVSSFRRHQTRHQSQSRRLAINTAFLGFDPNRYLTNGGVMSPVNSRKATQKSFTGLPQGMAARKRISNSHRRSKSTL